MSTWMPHDKTKNCVKIIINLSILGSSMIPKTVHVFTAGEQISTSGKKTDFTEEHLDQIVSTYDPAVHEAPILLGHKEGSGNPAYGWVKSLYREGKKLMAKIDFTENCKELIEAGHYRKRSSSFYQPDSPVNPHKGNWSFRHLAILGAEPPAVKSLEDFSFLESSEEYIAFEPQDVDASELNFEEVTDEKESKMTKTDPKDQLDEAIQVAEAAKAEEQEKADAVAAAPEGELPEADAPVEDAPEVAEEVAPEAEPEPEPEPEPEAAPAPEPDEEKVVDM